MWLRESSIHSLQTKDADPPVNSLPSRSPLLIVTHEVKTLYGKALSP